MVATSCGGDDEATETTAAPATTAAPSETTDAPTETTAIESTETTAATPAPSELGIGLILNGVKEEAFYATMIDSIDRVAAESPHGLDISLDIFENVAYADGERIIRDLASSDSYGIVLAHSSYSDAVAAVKDEFPDLVFAFSGSGNDPVGDNGYWLDNWVHEAAYLQGIIAGLMTQTNEISAVAAFPFPKTNAVLNGYKQGAQSVNPDIQLTASFIESWFDPVTAREAAAAQIATGSDMVYMERFGPLEAVREAEGTYAFGHYSDQSAQDPALVLSSDIALWDPAVMTLVDAWYSHTTEGTPYNAPLEPLIFSLAEGGTDIGTVSDTVPAEVQAAVAEARDAILSGELIVEAVLEPLE
jgi:basic membrane lipoprotein Med (substrate-binding protein (PBP1-ABC) superfamily)